jgi:uracil-DNA glycosylase
LRVPTVRMNQDFIEQFVNDLAREGFGEDVFNEYAEGDSNNALRRENLRRYLLEMAERKPKIFLVMEAPGYRGCRLTGVPVTSRKILQEGIPELKLFGEGYQLSNDAGFEDVFGEQSATIVWQTLSDLQTVPLIWNSFPFHPREAGKPRSNRAPRQAEKDLGRVYLHAMLEVYQPELCIAVGNVAAESLQRLVIPHQKVRHPAQGGKNDFVAGLRAILGNREES